MHPAEARTSREVLAKLPEIMEWAEGVFGPYPFSSVGAVVDRPHDAGYALETQTRPVFPGAPDTEILVHELAHQWYGDSVTPKSWRDMWLNEGFATYAEWLWQEGHGGSTAQQTFDALYRGDYYEDPADDAAIWAFPPARPSGAAQISESPVYERGAMVLHKIRQTVGDDAFYGIVRGWAATRRHGNADTADFTAYVERTAPATTSARSGVTGSTGRGGRNTPDAAGAVSPVPCAARRRGGPAAVRAAVDRLVAEGGPEGQGLGLFSSTARRTAVRPAERNRSSTRETSRLPCPCRWSPASTISRPIQGPGRPGRDGARG